MLAMARWMLVVVAGALAPAMARAQTSAPPAATGPQHDAPVARIRALLDERPGPPLLSSTTPGVPTFRVEIFGRPPELPDVVEQINDELAARPWFKPDFYYEIEASLPDIEVFSNIRKLRAAWYRHKVATARREVAAELEAVKAQQAAAASEPKPPKKQ